MCNCKIKKAHQAKKKYISKIEHSQKMRGYKIIKHLNKTKKNAA